MQQQEDIQFLAILPKCVSLFSYEIIRCRHVPWPLIVGAYEGYGLPEKREERESEREGGGELSQSVTKSTYRVKGNDEIIRKKAIFFWNTQYFAYIKAHFKTLIGVKTENRLFLICYRASFFSVLTT